MMQILKNRGKQSCRAESPSSVKDCDPRRIRVRTRGDKSQQGDAHDQSITLEECKVLKEVNTLAPSPTGSKAHSQESTDCGYHTGAANSAYTPGRPASTFVVFGKNPLGALM